MNIPPMERAPCSAREHSVTVSAYTITEQGLGRIISDHVAVTQLLRQINRDNVSVVTYQYLGGAISTVAWFMYGVKP